jgi:hypothetical protein
MAKLQIHIHDFTGVDPDCPVGFGALAEDYDEALMCRIAAALERSLEKAREIEPDVWTMIIAGHKNFVDLLAQKHLRAGNDLLARMFATPLTYGFDQHSEDYKNICANPAIQNYFRDFVLDKLLSLAASLRAIPVQNGEQGDFLPYLRESPDSLLDKIETKLHCKLRAPRFQGAHFGIKTRRGLLSERSVTALYVALRISELLKGVDRPRICEIGGGTGYVAYWCDQIGLTDYTIVDLPTVGAVQAYFLAQNLGSERVVLSGESKDDLSDRCVKLISGTDFSSGSFDFDILVNCDSFPEMAGSVMRDYLRRGHFVSRRLLSINQEAMGPRSGRHGDVQERVGDVLDEIGGFRRLTRCPFWLRPGYVEEVYDTLPLGIEDKPHARTSALRTSIMRALNVVSRIGMSTK